MTVFNIYCSEGRQTSDQSQPFMVIGALQCPRDDKVRIVNRLHKLMTLHGVKSSFSWKKLAQNKAEFYKSLIQLFNEETSLSFRCSVIDRNKIEDKLHDLDHKLNVYDIYFDLLVHYMQLGNGYYIYLDWQQNSYTSTFEEHRTALAHKLSGRSKLACLEPVDAHHQVLMQMSNILVGAVGYSYNQMQLQPKASVFKTSFIKLIANLFGREDLRAANQTNGKLDILTANF